MSTNGWNRTCLVCVILFVTFTDLGAKEPRGKSLPVTVAECERLVEQLANPSPPPFTERYVRRLPKGLSEAGFYKSQKPIADAYDTLSENIEVSLPVLIAHRRDERFSHVYDEAFSGPSYMCRSVGSTCAMLAFDHIDVHVPVITGQDANGRPTWFSIESRNDFQQWWQARKGKTLAELQLEGIEKAIRHAQPDYFTPQEWEAAQQKLRSLAAQIRETGKPIPVEHGLRFFSR